ncbi:hypothetical protein BpHYR1_032376 [Brachionus plicatilis]|uniref:Uncharacterized protein n=1 Tax=Brachionus plicatilis TaxID=10195 RepID=A0A3M7SH92_BRAPC|nr:hypothetical protein BpHYR1_032376 [Brachionus plicatilis]
MYEKDDDKSCDFLENTSLQKQNIRKLASSCSENAGSSLSVNGNRSKISSKVISNLAKKISNQNSSAIIDSVAGNSSTAVHSVSSLATSLAKLNFR